MGTLDKRATISDDGPPAPENAILASSTTSVDERTEGVKEIAVNVPPGSATLMVAVTGPDNEPAASRPRGLTQVQLQHPNGETVTAIADNEYGRVLFVVDKPQPGRWRLLVRHAKESAFVVRAVAMRDSALKYVREKWPTLRCAGCTEGLQAAAAIAVGMLAGAAATAAGVASVPAAIIASIANRTRLPEFVVHYLLERMFTSSLDQLIEGACERLEMCAGA